MSQYNNNNKVSDVLAQMTKKLFFLWKGRDKKKRCALAQVTKKQSLGCVSTNDKK
jgi:hypothetical protein